MENPHNQNYYREEAEEHIRYLKEALSKNDSREELAKAVLDIQRIVMNLEHTPPICGLPGFSFRDF